MLGLSRLNRKYAWKRDLPDFRDYQFEIKPMVLPALVDLRSKCPPPYDQGSLGSCVSFGVGHVLEFDVKQQGEKDFVPSHLFIYYNARVLEGTVNEDSGATVRDGIKTINQKGVCPETEWPYAVSQFKVRPTAKCYTDATLHKSVSYQSVAQNLAAMKTVLASGFPFVLGISVYSSFESDAAAQTGIVPLPAKHEQLLGGHCVACVGYDDSQQRFWMENSWGASWGQKGFFTIPYAYLTNAGLASDFWVVQKVK